MRIDNAPSDLPMMLADIYKRLDEIEERLDDGGMRAGDVGTAKPVPEVPGFITEPTRAQMWMQTALRRERDPDWDDRLREKLAMTVPPGGGTIHELDRRYLRIQELEEDLLQARLERDKADTEVERLKRQCSQAEDEHAGRE